MSSAAADDVACVPDQNLAERDIRAALLCELRSGFANAEVVEEFSAAGGRLDVLAISCTTLAGYEIKSDFDSLDRVEAQIAAFGRYADTLTFVAGRRHAFTLLRELPLWCGVTLAYRINTGVSLVELRESRQNPVLDMPSRVSLLWRAELLRIIGLSSRSPGRRSDLCEQLLNEHPFEQLRTLVSEELRRRLQSAPAQRPESGDGLSQLAATYPGFLFSPAGSR
jgi:hypothetical protein